MYAVVSNRIPKPTIHQLYCLNVTRAGAEKSADQYRRLGVSVRVIEWNANGAGR